MKTEAYYRKAFNRLTTISSDFENGTIQQVTGRKRVVRTYSRDFMPYYFYKEYDKDNEDIYLQKVADHLVKLRNNLYYFCNCYFVATNTYEDKYGVTDSNAIEDVCNFINQSARECCFENNTFYIPQQEYDITDIDSLVEFDKAINFTLANAFINKQIGHCDYCKNPIIYINNRTHLCSQTCRRSYDYENKINR